MRFATWVLVVLAVPALAARGSASTRHAGEQRGTSGWTTHHDQRWGYTVSFPNDWNQAPRPISRITEPREILSLATFPLRYRPTDCDVQKPLSKGRAELRLVHPPVLLVTGPPGSFLPARTRGSA